MATDREAIKRRKASTQQETKIAQELGGRRQIASGALPTRKSDVVDTQYGFRVEAKRTERKEYRLTTDVIEKIRKEALRGGDNWLLQIDFDLTNRRVAVLDYEVLLAILREWHGHTDTE